MTTELRKTPFCPLLPQHHRRVAHLGLAMDNLESEWDFDPATLALAKTPGHFALRVCAVDLKNAPQTAEARDKIKQCLAASQIAVETENIKVKPLRAGSTSTLQDVFIVARLLPKASKMIQLLCNGPAGAYRQLFDLKEIGGIPSKVDSGDVRALGRSDGRALGTTGVGSVVGRALGSGDGRALGRGDGRALGYTGVGSVVGRIGAREVAVIGVHNIRPCRYGFSLRWPLLCLLSRISRRAGSRRG